MGLFHVEIFVNKVIVLVLFGAAVAGVCTINLVFSLKSATFAGRLAITITESPE